MPSPTEKLQSIENFYWCYREILIDVLYSILLAFIFNMYRVKYAEYKILFITEKFHERDATQTGIYKTVQP